LNQKLNEVLLESIEETITALLSRQVVESIFLNLKTVHSIPRCEIPHRLDILIFILEKIFGLQGSKTISKAISRKAYAKLDLPFLDIPNRTLLEHVEQAKIRLSKNNGEVELCSLK
jgi:hypothetical protein